MLAHKGGGTFQQAWHKYTTIHNTMRQAKTQTTASMQAQGKAEDAEAQPFTLTVQATDVSPSTGREHSESMLLAGRIVAFSGRVENEFQKQASDPAAFQVSAHKDQKLHIDRHARQTSKLFSTSKPSPYVFTPRSLLPTTLVHTAGDLLVLTTALHLPDMWRAILNPASQHHLHCEAVKHPQSCYAPLPSPINSGYWL